MEQVRVRENKRSGIYERANWQQKHAPCAAQFIAVHVFQRDWRENALLIILTCRNLLLKKSFIQKNPTHTLLQRINIVMEVLPEIKKKSNCFWHRFLFVLFFFTLSLFTTSFRLHNSVLWPIKMEQMEECESKKKKKKAIGQRSRNSLSIVPMLSDIVALFYLANETRSQKVATLLQKFFNIFPSTLYFGTTCFRWLLQQTGFHPKYLF